MLYLVSGMAAWTAAPVGGAIPRLCVCYYQHKPGCMGTPNHTPHPHTSYTPSQTREVLLLNLPHCRHIVLRSIGSVDFPSSGVATHAVRAWQACDEDLKFHCDVCAYVSTAVS